MGGCRGSKLSIYALIPSITKWKTQFDALSLSDGDITTLYHIFKRIGGVKADHISVSDMLKYFHLENSEFMRRALSVFSSTKYQSEEINFREFVFIIWNYCTLGTDIALFAFDMYDFDGNQCLDAAEADILLKDIYGKYYVKSKNGQRLNEKIQQHGAHGVQRFYFKEFVVANPAVVAPCFEYQKRIVSRTLGSNEWGRLTQERVILTRGKYASPGEILALSKARAQSRSSFDVETSGSGRSGSLDDIIQTKAHLSSRRSSRSSRNSIDRSSVDSLPSRTSGECPSPANRTAIGQVGFEDDSNPTQPHHTKKGKRRYSIDSSNLQTMSKESVSLTESNSRGSFSVNKHSTIPSGYEPIVEHQVYDLNVPLGMSSPIDKPSSAKRKKVSTLSSRVSPNVRNQPPSRQLSRRNSLGTVDSKSPQSTSNRRSTFD